jgi:hypothetical protein
VDPDAHTRFPLYVGASLLRRRDFERMYHHSRDFSVGPETIANSLKQVTGIIANRPLPTIFNEYSVQGNSRKGYTLFLKPEGAELSREQMAVYKTLGSNSNTVKAFLPNEAPVMALIQSRDKFPDSALSVLSNLLPLDITLEPAKVALLSSHRLYEVNKNQ